MLNTLCKEYTTLIHCAHQPQNMININIEQTLSHICQRNKDFWKCVQDHQESKLNSYFH